MFRNRKLNFLHGLMLGLMVAFIVLILNSSFSTQLIHWAVQQRSGQNSFHQRPANFHQLSDSNVHNDDGSVAQKLREQVRVLIAIMTSPKNLETRAQAVKDTWGKHGNNIIYFSTTENKTFPTIPLNVPEGTNHLTSKTMAGFDYIYKHYYNDFDWFMKADDDTYVIMENLRYFLSSQNFGEPVFFGLHFSHYVKNGYNDGGAGYVLSKESLRRFGHRGNNSNCFKDGPPEDIDMARCLDSLGVQIANTTDFLGRTRFHTFIPSVHINGNYAGFYHKFTKHGDKKGIESMSDYVITFHRVTPIMMVELQYYVYHLRPFGICNGERNLNTENNKRSLK